MKNVTLRFQKKLEDSMAHFIDFGNFDNSTISYAIPIYISIILKWSRNGISVTLKRKWE